MILFGLDIILLGFTFWSLNKLLYQDNKKYIITTVLPNYQEAILNCEHNSEQNSEQNYEIPPLYNENNIS